MLTCLRVNPLIKTPSLVLESLEIDCYYFTSAFRSTTESYSGDNSSQAECGLSNLIGERRYLPWST